MSQISSSTSALNAQLQQLQQQCADWRGCATTSARDKQQILGELGTQIQDIQKQIAQQTNAGDGINRPRQDETLGGTINLSV